MRWSSFTLGGGLRSGRVDGRCCGPRLRPRGSDGLACAAIEAFTRSLAGEVGRQGVRVVALRPNFAPETNPGVPEEALQPLVKDTLLGRLPRLAEVAGAAVFATSEQGVR